MCVCVCVCVYLIAALNSLRLLAFFAFSNPPQIWLVFRCVHSDTHSSTCVSVTDSRTHVDPNIERSLFDTRVFFHRHTFPKLLNKCPVLVIIFIIFALSFTFSRFCE